MKFNFTDGIEAIKKQEEVHQQLLELEEVMIECKLIIDHTCCDILRHKHTKRYALLVRAWNTRCKVMSILLRDYIGLEDIKGFDKIHLNIN
jgi:hypothetical protein